MSNMIREPLLPQLPSKAKLRAVAGRGGFRGLWRDPTLTSEVQGRAFLYSLCEMLHQSFTVEMDSNREGKDPSGPRRSVPRVRFSFLGQ